MSSSYGIGQEYKLEEKTVTKVFEVADKNKSELFSSINKWISINYNSAKNVIQMNDKEAGTIIIKGINKIDCDVNTTKNSYTYNFVINHTIEVNIKDNKYRIIYRMTDIKVKSEYEWPSVFYNCIVLNGSNDNALTEYEEYSRKVLKSLSKKKLKESSDLIKPMFEDINTCILNDIKKTIKSIELSTISKAEDEW
jgi:hypothetical protein